MARGWGLWREIAALAAAAALLLTPAAINGQPFIFTDTAAYLKLGGAMVARIVGPLAQTPREAEPAGGGADAVEEELAQAAAGGGEDVARALTHYGSRSGYYSFLAFALKSVGTLWLAAFAQALALAWVVRVAQRAIAPNLGLLHFLGGIAALSLASSAGFFASYLMPDIFAGIALVGAVALAFYRDRLDWPARWGLLAMLALSAAFHQTILVIIAAVGVMGVVFAPRSVGPWWSTAAALAAPIAAALIATSAYKAVVTHALGAEPRNPPFLMARVLEDGPGRAYLPIACARADLAICAFRDRRLEDADTFLWSEDPEVGVFFAADIPTRTRLLDEELGFVVGAIAHQPVEQVQASISAGLRQAASFSLKDALHIVISPAEQAGVFFNDSNGAQRYRETAVARAAFPFLAFDFLTLAGLAAAVAAWGWRLARPASPALEAERRLAMIVAASVIVALLANAGVCGALSAVHDRFQGRVIWVVPLFAMLYWLALRDRSARPG